VSKDKKPFLQRCDAGEVSKPVQYIYNFGQALSQFANAVILLGDPDESISGRTGKASRKGIWWFSDVQEPFINMLFQDPDHCEKSIEDDEGCKQLWDWEK
jgi:hypothetical protein